MAYDNELQGILFINDKKGNDKAPDRKGKIQIEGKVYELAGWIRESKAGTKFLSLKATPPETSREYIPEPSTGDDTPIEF